MCTYWHFCMTLYMPNINKRIWDSSKNTVFGYKKRWKTISISFPKSFEGIHINFSQIYIAFIHKKDSHRMDNFLYYILKQSRKKSRKYRFWLQKRVKIQKNIIFENFGGWLYNDSTLILTSSHFRWIYSQKHIFL